LAFPLKVIRAVSPQKNKETNSEQPYNEDSSTGPDYLYAKSGVNRAAPILYPKLKKKYSEWTKVQAGFD
jgi:hypothetical protein